MKLISLFISALLLTLTPLMADSIKWHDDFAAAQKLAKEQDKPMLVEFTGSDWCTWCIRLNQEVFSKPEFQTYAEENLVMVKLDFPRKKELSADVQAQNRKLAQEYNIEGFPTILLMDAEGEVIARTGYRRGGPESYVSHLKEELAKK